MVGPREGRQTYGSGVLERPETLKPVDHAHRSRPSEVCNIAPHRKGILGREGGGFSDQSNSRCE